MTEGTGEMKVRQVLLISAEPVPSVVARVLAAAGFAVASSPLAAGVGEAARESRPDIVVLVYSSEQRHRAWNVLTILRGARALRALPVVVVTNDAGKTHAFTDAFARLGITVLIGPDDVALVSGVAAALEP